MAFYCVFESSAMELHEIRTSKNEPRPLPSLGKKDFFPTCSPEEKSNIDAMIQERMSCMSEERVVKKLALSKLFSKPVL